MKRLSLIALLSMAMLSCSATSSELTLEQKAAKLLIVGVEGTSLEANNAIIPDLKDRGVSGVILFERNIAPENSKETLSRFIGDMKALSKDPIFVSIDQEGGLVNRLKTKYGFEEMPSHQMVGAARSIGYGKEVGGIIASEVASMGFNINFAPCVDLNVNPECPVIGKIGRSFSNDENRVTELATDYIEAHNSRGVITALKHFPGHGSSATDSHLGLTDITTTWSERELIPYRNLIEGGYNDMIMVSHLFNSDIDPTYPATLSKATIEGVLRGDIGWDGVVVSDDMQMKAITDHYGFEEGIILAINAGVDLFVISRYGNDALITDRFISTIVDAVNNGELQMSQLDAAVRRIEKLRTRLK